MSEELEYWKYQFQIEDVMYYKQHNYQTLHLGYLYEQVPPNLAEFLKDSSYEQLYEWQRKESEKYVIRLYGMAIRYFPVFGGRSVSPLKRDFDDNILIGDGIHDVIVRKNNFKEYYTSHVISWNTPSTYIKPYQFDENFTYEQGLEFEKNGGFHNKEAFNYHFNPSRYDGFVQGFRAFIHGQYGVYGYLPGVVATSPMNLVFGDILEVDDPKNCGYRVKFSYQYITCPYTPLTYPFWVDAYPCIEVPPPEIKMNPVVGGESSEIPEEATLKVIMRWENNSAVELRGYIVLDRQEYCAYDQPVLVKSNGSIVQATTEYFTKGVNHLENGDAFHYDTLEWRLSGVPGTRLSLAVFTDYLFGGDVHTPYELTQPVIVDVILDKVGHEPWELPATVYSDSCKLLKRYEIPPELFYTEVQETGETIAAGNAGEGKYQEFLVDVGILPGTVTVNYDMYGYPDRLIIKYQGEVVADTGEPVAYTGSLSFYYQPVGGDNSITLIFTSDSDGTAYEFTVVKESPPGPPIQFYNKMVYITDLILGEYPEIETTDNLTSFEIMDKQGNILVPDYKAKIVELSIGG